MSENIGKLTTANNDFTGVVVDGLITRIVGKDSVYIKGGENINTSSWIFLYNNSDSYIKDNPNASFFRITIPTTDTTSYSNALCGNINHLTWMGKDIDSIYSSGDNYIQYTNGLGICWVRSENTTVPPSQITFPFSFVDIPAISISPRGNANSNIAYIHKVADISSTGCIVMAVKTTTDSEYVVSTYTLIAIGMWKPV